MECFSESWIILFRVEFNWLEFWLFWFECWFESKPGWALLIRDESNCVRLIWKLEYQVCNWIIVENQIHRFFVLFELSSKYKTRLKVVDKQLWHSHKLLSTLFLRLFQCKINNKHVMTEKGKAKAYLIFLETMPIFT